MTPDPNELTRFGLLRHGKTIWNQQKRIQGSADSPLTAEGIKTCQAWARFLSTSGINWHRLLVSPLQRTIDTAGIINAELQLPLHIAEGVREMDWGAWEGMTLAEIKSSSPERFAEGIKQGWEFRPEDGESRREVLHRVRQTLTEMTGKWPGENLLVISHLGVIKSLLYDIEDRQFLPEEPKIIWKDRFHIIGSRGGELSIEKSNITLPGHV